ncbi:hypothetical protein OOT46_12335 [Aquabacterium sp. A7-Y]|nr:hypothetical protein [Aquabacterium sp. A7-Y]MCW7538631.1 hypothetical protein [Aquabacterium sp. A7-Y]
MALAALQPPDLIAGGAFSPPPPAALLSSRRLDAQWLGPLSRGPPPFS